MQYCEVQHRSLLSRQSYRIVYADGLSRGICPLIMPKLHSIIRRVDLCFRLNICSVSSLEFLYVEVELAVLLSDVRCLPI